jgi:hypothetical protein
MTAHDATTKPRRLSAFWAAGGVLTAPEWEARERGIVHPAEALTMREWFDLSETQRCAIVSEYAGAKPRRLLLAEEYRRDRRIEAGLPVRRLWAEGLEEAERG